MSLKVESKVCRNECMDIDLFNFLSDFSRFTKLLPPEHQSKIKATADECSISAGVMGDFTLRFIEKESPKLLKIGTVSSKEALTLWIQIKQIAPYDTRIKVTIMLEIGMVQKMMIKGKIQQFADSLAEGIAKIPPYVLQMK